MIWNALQGKIVRSSYIPKENKASRQLFATALSLYSQLPLATSLIINLRTRYVVG
jgi:hypothetical protein